MSCGELYEKEQEDDLKDKMDFGIPKPELYPANGSYFFVQNIFEFFYSKVLRY